MLQLLAGGLISADDLVAGASCIHSECLDASLSRSLQVMNIETVGGPHTHVLCQHLLPMSAVPCIAVES